MVVLLSNAVTNDSQTRFDVQERLAVCQLAITCHGQNRSFCLGINHCIYIPEMTASIALALKVPSRFLLIRN